MAKRSTELSELTPAELVERIRRGDGLAETELYERYAGRLLSILRRETGDEDSAREICQETFLRTLESLRKDGPADPEKIGGYIYGVAKNLWRSGWRRAARQQTDANTELIESIAADEVNPYLCVSEMQLIRAVRESVSQLPIGRDREIAYRLFLDEADAATVCHELNVTREHLSRLRYRVLKRLREVMTPEAIESAESMGIAERKSR